jgi:hypothetical protein
VKVGEREVKIYAVSFSAFKRYVGRGLRRVTSGGDSEFIYLGSKETGAFGWRNTLDVPHKVAGPVYGFFKRGLLSRLFNEYKEIVERVDLKRYFVVCDEEGAAAKKCIRFAVADFLINMFCGQKLNNVEREVVELIVTQGSEPFGGGLMTESFYVDIDVLDSMWVPERGSVRFAFGAYVYRRGKLKKESGFFEEKRTPLFVLYANLQTGARCIYPRVPVHVWEELGAELVVNA